MTSQPSRGDGGSSLRTVTEWVLEAQDAGCSDECTICSWIACHGGDVALTEIKRALKRLQT